MYCKTRRANLNEVLYIHIQVFMHIINVLLTMSYFNVGDENLLNAYVESNFVLKSIVNIYHHIICISRIDYCTDHSLPFQENIKNFSFKSDYRDN